MSIRLIHPIMTVLCLSLPGWLSSIAWALEFTPQQIYEQSAPAVVFVMASPDHGAGNGGTGSLIRSDGLILTNAHVVFDKASNRPYPRIWVFLKPDRVTGNTKADLAKRLAAHVIAHDESLDLALLQIEETGRFPALPFGDPSRVRIGDRVLAIGHPEQGGLWTLTSGLISAEFENFDGIAGKHVFQTDTGLNRGNSGGPLLDGQGRLIGINTAMARLAKDGTPITSINFAIEASVAQHWLQGLGIRMAYAGDDPSRTDTHQPIAADTPAAPPPSPAPKATAAASPSRIQTETRPYDLDRLLSDLQQQEMKEMEALILEMRERLKKQGR
jgi:serine protease Do